MMTRMLAFCACAGLLLWLAGPAFAGPNEGGTLILHANPSLTFTSDISNYCGMAGLDSCSHAVTSVPWEPGKKIVFHALAAFPPESSPRLKGLSFGISYDPAKFILAARGSCADFELPDGTWPASGTGTAQTWTTETQTGALTECYWFAGYAYAENEEIPNSTTVELIPHPLHGGRFIDDAFPAQEDTIAGYGKLAIGTTGGPLCPPLEAAAADAGTEGVPPNGPSGPDSPAEETPSLQVMPSFINAGWGRWTFLTSGGTEGLRQVVLDLDGDRFEPTCAQQTSSTSCLWTFVFPPRSAPRSVLLRRPGGTAADSLVAIAVDSSPADPREGAYAVDSFTFVPARGSLGYPRGSFTCTLPELVHPDSTLYAALQQLGVIRLRKVGRSPGEDPVTDSDRVMPRLLRTYVATVQPCHSMPALAAMMAGIHAVELAKPAGVVRAWTQDPCAYEAAGDTFYPNQWYLQPHTPTTFTTDAAYGWCDNQGCDWAGHRANIVVIDFPLLGYPSPMHADLTRPDGSSVVSLADDLHFNNCPEDSSICHHSLHIAGLAAAAANQVFTVGIAYEASVLLYELPYGALDDDLVLAFKWVYDRSPYMDRSPIVSCSVATEVEPDGLQYWLDCLVSQRGVAVICAEPGWPPVTYPSVWDQSSGTGLVLSVGASNKAGEDMGVPMPKDIFAPAESLWVPDKLGALDTFTCVTSATPSLSVPQVAAAGAMYQVQYDWTCGPADIYDQLMGRARVAGGGRRILNVGNTLGVTGITDITNVYAFPGNSECTIHWEVLDAENISGFWIYDRPSCGGRWELRRSVENAGEGSYNETLEAPYLRPYYYKMVAHWGGATATYPCAAVTPLTGEAVVFPTVPTPEFTSMPAYGGRLRWLRSTSPSASEFVVYREMTPGPMATCVSYRGVVVNNGLSCTDPPNTMCACWYDHDLVPGLPFSYRIGAVVRDLQGRVRCEVQSSEVVGEIPVAGVGDERSVAGSDNGELSCQIVGSPSTSGGAVRVRMRSSATRYACMGMYDTTGRCVRGGERRIVVPIGESTVELDGGTRLPAGVYFLVVRCDSGEQVERRYVVVD